MTGSRRARCMKNEMSVVRQSINIDIGAIFTELTAKNVIGSGSFGTVYSAHMLLPDKKLAGIVMQ